MRLGFAARDGQVELRGCCCGGETCYDFHYGVFMAQVEEQIVRGATSP